MKLQQNKIRLFILFTAAMLLVHIGPEHADSKQASKNYFYKQEKPSYEHKNSCSNIFAKVIKSNSTENLTGEILYNLKYVNVHYLLGDYDDALRKGSRKKYVAISDLQNEVDLRKRDVYCRIELAMHIQARDFSNKSDYQDYLDEALENISTTYLTAKESFAKKNFARANYAFNLIAPYKDSYEMYLESSAIIQEIAHKEMTDAKELQAKATEPMAASKGESLVQTPQAETVADLTKKETTEPVAGAKTQAETGQEIRAEETTQDRLVEKDAEELAPMLATNSAGPIIRAVQTGLFEEIAQAGAIAKAVTNSN